MKFGIIVRKDNVRRTLPLIEDCSKAMAIFVATVQNEGWEIDTVEENPFWWNNCLYGGNAVGHSHGFCTAGACY